ncbi:MAG: 16S rRNA pseudouridine(516) synthase RsuA [Marinobacter sp.]|uniref:16S rRNA pseudouridine(516) synthase RsuA n=1 Tax=Marinobacter sp. TaxID=50741 RepID=UPI001B6B4C2F|nr:16S rRNA pseudouridine(516) synthase RsuA [Marinobacter sp.]MBQ0747344.1 16S rRNA pseudouridine(516) synthase RsuA [Marinobacter sp.]MBQ0812819.1 16S rRNA pseudouridine(516) synthase RsuA [Marinobacter sp.]|tara:strand:+ start:8790 stop:9482 length:693 start_codon:yes stop_codon:yes gene_type:complete
MRLDQFIATSSTLSRKEARRAIHAGNVEVDGEVWKGTGKHLPAGAQVMLEGVPLTLPGERYLMLNKPAGVVSATRDSDHPTALDLLPAELTSKLHIAGRLDADTTGLLLLTTDGQWSHRITSPKVDCPKTYRVSLSTPLSESAIKDLETGVMLHNDPKPTKPAQVKVLEQKLIELTISEGRYHQVKRMLAAAGNHVEALHRQSIGSITLDPALEPGDYRELTEQEVASAG